MNTLTWDQHSRIMGDDKCKEFDRETHIDRDEYSHRQRSNRSHDDVKSYQPQSSNLSYRKTNSRKARRKAKDSKPFDGVKIEWCDYLKHFLYVAEWNDWDDEEIAEQLVMTFDGQALKLLGELDNHILGNFTLLVRELNRRFDPTEWAEAWKIEFHSRFRKPKESVMLYTQDIIPQGIKSVSGTA